MVFFFKFYCIYILSIFLFWLIGYGIKKLLKISDSLSYTSILFNTLTGLIAFATIVAIISTKGKTVMILSILFGAILYLVHKKEKNVNTVESSNSKEIKLIFLNLLLGCSMIFILLFFSYTKDNFIVFLNSDYCFYADLSYQIIHTGVEHYYTNYVMPPSGLQPYHYLEIWLNGGVALFTQQNYLMVFLLVTYPIFIFLVYTGLCVLLNHISFKPAFIPWVAFLATFTTGIFIPDIPFYQYLQKKFYVDLYTNILWDYHKLSIPYTFIVTTIILFIKREIKSAYIVLLYIPVFYSTVAPALFCGIGLLAVYLLLFKKEHGKWLFGQLVIASTILFLFYAVFQDKSVSLSLVLDTNIRNKINIIGNTTLGIFFIYWYILLIAFIFLRKEVISMFRSLPYTWLIIFVPVFGLLTWAMLSKNLDSVQMFSNVAMLVLNSSAIGVLFMLLKDKRKTIFFILLIFISGCSMYYKVFRNFAGTNYKVETEKLKLIKKIFENNPNRLGVFLRDTSEFKISLFRVNGYSSSMVYDFSCVFSDNYAVLLNVHEVNPTVFSETHKQKIAEKMVKISIFNRYIEKQKRENRFVSIEKSQLDFIKEYKVSYIATKPNYVLPAHLASLVKEKVDLGDLIIYLLD